MRSGSMHIPQMVVEPKADACIVLWKILCTSLTGAFESAQGQCRGLQFGLEAMALPGRTPSRGMWDCFPAPTPSRRAMLLQIRWRTVLCHHTTMVVLCPAHAAWTFEGRQAAGGLN